MFEILKLVQSGSPIEATLLGSPAAEQRQRVSQSLAAIAEIVDSPVVEPLEVANATADVPFQRHAVVRRDVEDLLSRQNVGRQSFVAYSRADSECGRRLFVKCVQRPRSST